MKSSTTGASAAWVPPNNMNDKELEDKLSKYYEISKAKAASYTKLAANSEMNVSNNLAARTYFVLSTLLFTSVNAVKIEEYEQFLAQSAKKLPSNMFNWIEWEEIIDSAKLLRTKVPSLQDLDIGELVAAFDAPAAIQSDIGKTRLLQLKKKLIPLLQKERAKYSTMKQTLKETENKYFSSLLNQQAPKHTRLPGNNRSGLILGDDSLVSNSKLVGSLLEDSVGHGIPGLESHVDCDAPQKGFREWSRVLRRSLNDRSTLSDEGRNPFLARPTSASAILYQQTDATSSENMGKNSCVGSDGEQALPTHQSSQNLSSKSTDGEDSDRHIHMTSDFIAISKTVLRTGLQTASHSPTSPSRRSIVIKSPKTPDITKVKRGLKVFDFGDVELSSSPVNENQASGGPSTRMETSSSSPFGECKNILEAISVLESELTGECTDSRSGSICSTYNCNAATTSSKSPARGQLADKSHTPKPRKASPSKRAAVESRRSNNTMSKSSKADKDVAGTERCATADVKMSSSGEEDVLRMSTADKANVEAYDMLATKYAALLTERDDKRREVREAKASSLKLEQTIARLMDDIHSKEQHHQREIADRLSEYGKERDRDVLKFSALRNNYDILLAKYEEALSAFAAIRSQSSAVVATIESITKEAGCTCSDLDNADSVRSPSTFGEQADEPHVDDTTTVSSEIKSILLKIPASISQCIAAQRVRATALEIELVQEMNTVKNKLSESVEQRVHLESQLAASQSNNEELEYLLEEEKLLRTSELSDNHFNSRTQLDTKTEIINGLSDRIEGLELELGLTGIYLTSLVNELGASAELCIEQQKCIGNMRPETAARNAESPDRGLPLASSHLDSCETLTACAAAGTPDNQANAAGDTGANVRSMSLKLVDSWIDTYLANDEPHSGPIEVDEPTRSAASVFVDHLLQCSLRSLLLAPSDEKLYPIVFAPKTTDLTEALDTAELAESHSAGEVDDQARARDRCNELEMQLKIVTETFVKAMLQTNASMAAMREENESLRQQRQIVHDGSQGRPLTTQVDTVLSPEGFSQFCPGEAEKTNLLVTQAIDDNALEEGLTVGFHEGDDLNDYQGSTSVDSHKDFLAEDSLSRVVVTKIAAPVRLLGFCAGLHVQLVGDDAVSSDMDSLLLRQLSIKSEVSIKTYHNNNNYNCAHHDDILYLPGDFYDCLISAETHYLYGNYVEALQSYQSGLGTLTTTLHANMPTCLLHELPHLCSHLWLCQANCFKALGNLPMALSLYDRILDLPHDRYTASTMACTCWRPACESYVGKASILIQYARYEEAEAVCFQVGCLTICWVASAIRSASQCRRSNGVELISAARKTL
jgi:hypothetical protein